MSKKKSFKMIGCGGIGTMLMNPLCKYLEYGPFNNPKFTVIDGDHYEDRNLERQLFNQIGPKAEITASNLQKDYPRLKVLSHNQYLNSKNISSLISEGDVVFVCVDNHATRKLISDYVSKLNNIVVISGGNDYTDGNVLTFIRKNGKNLTPLMTEYDENIAKPKDKIPKNKPKNGCEVLQKSEPQLVVMNNQIAARMLSVFYATNNGKVIPEVYEDIIVNKARPAERKINNKIRSKNKK